MTKKDYVAIAKILREVKAVHLDSVEMYRSLVVSRLARYFVSLNDLFDPEMFKQACYAEDNDND